MNGASRRTQGNQMLESGKGHSQNNPMPTRSLKQRSLKQRRWMRREPRCKASNDQGRRILQ